jgi:galactose oxidase
VQIFTLGGSWSGGEGGKDGEKLPAGGTWQRLANVPVSRILTNDPQGVYRADNHGWFFAWSGSEGDFDIPYKLPLSC